MTRSPPWEHYPTSAAPFRPVAFPHCAESEHGQLSTLTEGFSADQQLSVMLQHTDYDHTDDII